jgi:hypothetical protein
VQLRWKGDWSRYPTSDLDVYAFDADDFIFFDGATLNSPEDYVIDEPTAGPMTFLVDGFTVFKGDDKWELSVLADGKLVKKNR